MKLFRKSQYGIRELKESKHYYMVRVGKLWVRDQLVGYGTVSLTDDFRDAITYTEVDHNFFPPPLYTLKKAFKHAELYGGKVVRLTVTIEEVEESE